MELPEGFRLEGRIWLNANADDVPGGYYKWLERRISDKVRRIRSNGLQ
jgi:hypothetical protein